MFGNHFEQDLRSFDYSVFSNVRKSLLQDLLQQHRRDNANNVPTLFDSLRTKRLTDDELDCVAAAGQGQPPHDLTIQPIK